MWHISTAAILLFPTPFTSIICSSIASWRRTFIHKIYPIAFSTQDKRWSLRQCDISNAAILLLPTFSSIICPSIASWRRELILKIYPIQLTFLLRIKILPLDNIYGCNAMQNITFDLQLGLFWNGFNCVERLSCWESRAGMKTRQMAYLCVFLCVFLCH